MTIPIILIMKMFKDDNTSEIRNQIDGDDLIKDNYVIEVL